jgi:hypothetical protein
MSTSLLYHAFGLKKYDYVSTEYVGGRIKFNIRPKACLLMCPVCGSKDIEAAMWKEKSRVCR